MSRLHFYYRGRGGGPRWRGGGGFFWTNTAKRCLRPPLAGARKHATWQSTVLWLVFPLTVRGRTNWWRDTGDRFLVPCVPLHATVEQTGGKYSRDAAHHYSLFCIPSRSVSNRASYDVDASTPESINSQSKGINNKRKGWFPKAAGKWCRKLMNDWNFHFSLCRVFCAWITRYEFCHTQTGHLALFWGMYVVR